MSFKTVSHTSFCENVTGVAGVGFQFLAQVGDIDVDIVDAILIFPPPYLVKNILIGQHLAGILQEVR